MTGEQLREELARLGDGAPVAHVSPDTWRRARRARTRDRVVGALGAVAAVALVAGLAAVVLPSGDDGVPVASGGPALPDRLYAVPGRDATDLASTDLAVGVGAVAWLTDPGSAVVVDADDGSYHLLTLPGLFGDGQRLLASSSTAAPVVLSPDGTRLAYPRRDGLGIVDLVGGEVRAVRLPIAPVLVDRLVWSADGGHVAWQGSEYSGSGDTFTTSVEMVAGSVDATTGTLTAFAGTPSVDDALTVSDDGEVAFVHGTDLDPQVYGGSIPRGGFYAADVSAVGVLDRSGRRVLVGFGTERGAAVPPEGAAGVVVDLARPGATARFVNGGADLATTPLGWSADGRALVAVNPDGRGPTVLLAEDDGTREVLTSDYPAPDRTGVPGEISVATDLVTADRPSVSRPAPDWPWHPSPQLLSALIGLGAALAVALLLAARWGWRASRRGRAARAG